MTFIEDLKKPINIFFVALSVAGLLFGLYSYYDSHKTKTISYQITDPPAIVYDSENASSAIKLFEHDSIPIKDNVYLLTGTLWNSGNITILNDDVRRQLVLSIDSAKDILDFQIVKEIDPEIAKFSLRKINKQNIAVSWKYFDPGYAIKFQIIFAGSEKSKFHIGGKILDVKKFDNVPERESNETSYFALFMTGILPLFIMRPLKEITRNFSVKALLIIKVFLIILLTMNLIFVLFKAYEMTQTVIPIPFT